MKKILMMVIILVLGLSVQSKAQEYRIELDPHGNSIIYFCTENAVYVENRTPGIMRCGGCPTNRSQRRYSGLNQ
mgnify:CR=1 FL=1